LIPVFPEFKNLEEMSADLKTSADRATYSLGRLQERYGGQALKALGVYTGTTKQLKNWQEELAETLGYLMIPALERMDSALIPLTQKMAEFIGQHKTLVGTAALSGFAVGKILPGLGELVQTLALTKLAFPGILAGFVSLGKLMPLVGLIASAIYVVAASFDHLWQVFSSGGDVMKNFGAALYNIIRGPINVFIAAIGLLNTGINSLLSMVGIKFHFPTWKLWGTKEYDLPAGTTIKSPADRLNDLMKAIEKALKPMPSYGPPGPEEWTFEDWMKDILGKAGGGGRAKEVFTSRMSGWSESMFATHPVRALAGGGGIGTANVTVNIGSATRDDAQHISRVVTDEINKMLKHTSDNFPEW
jgi:hypothetical protein